MARGGKAVRAGHQGMRGKEGRRTNDEAGIRAVQLQPDFKTMQACRVENIKDIYMVTKMFEYTFYLRQD